MALQAIYNAAAWCTRHRIDDVAGRASVSGVLRFRANRPVAIQGPVRAFVADGAPDQDPEKAAVRAVQSGRPLSLLASVYRNMPGMGEGAPPADIVQLRTPEGEHTYWFAAGREEQHRPAQVLLSGDGAKPDVAISLDSLRMALAAASFDRAPVVTGVLRDLVAVARDKGLAIIYPPAACRAIEARQATITEAGTLTEARRLHRLSGLSTVPVQIERQDLLDDPRGLLAEIRDRHAWTVRQPVFERGSGHLEGFLDGPDGLAQCSRSLEAQPSAFLYLDAERLEFDTARHVERATPGQEPDRLQDMLSAVVRETKRRDTLSVVQHLTTGSAGRKN